MKLVNCSECGRVFSSSGSSICPDCRRKEEEEFELVKDYLWDNPNSTVEEVAEETGVDRDRIIKFMKENRLESEGLVIKHSLECKRCGKEISSGIFCSSCRNKMVNELNQKDEEEKPKAEKKKEQMFLKDRFKRNK